MFISRVAAVAVVLVVLVPGGANAGETRAQRGDIVIEWNGEFDADHGVVGGSGTMDDPYVISGWSVKNISIRDTTKALRIEGNTITGTLRLNFVGHHVEVAGNDIGDLRVNENIARWGDPTGGLITGNAITSVGQLRHFDGTFSNNTVGTPRTGSVGSPYPAKRAVNADGFNGANVVDNTIFGYVDARLHGHHHSSAFDDDSHAHASSHPGMEMDHTQRYHRATFAGNIIHTSAKHAFVYLDTDHDANDRTAASETNPELHAPHTHHTAITVANNQLFGAGILVNVFNANSPRHTVLSRGALDIVGNTVTLGYDPRHHVRALGGIQIQQARAVTLTIGGNTVTGPIPPLEVTQLQPLLNRGAGVLLDTMDDAHVIIDGLTVTNRRFGIQAKTLSASVHWSVRNLTTTGVEEPIRYDASVENPPDVG